MEPLSINAARELIATIRVDKGGISPEARADSHPETLRALENVRRELGRATKTFVDQLYSKDTRFVYELIQNAEDNTYTRAEGKIYLGFSLYPDRLVLDSNEDGFREEHVRAICSTGASTKAVSQGFIGEKGIGFKSVFKVAKKVHVQSHPFSFSFSHRRDSSDDGLGMITPYEEDYDDLPENVNTRITLTLLDPSSFEQRADELLTLPDTLLLFLPKLQLLHIKIYPQNEKATEIMFTHTSHENKLETITKTTTSDGKSTERNIRFYVLRRDVRDLSSDKARENNNEATVVLAFPVDGTPTPIIEKQLSYAFLPLKQLGFKFLIQSDFILQANREDVVHSKRNKDLLQGVAETFRDAVLHFCQHPILRYQWMRYLPDDSISDEFWRELKPLMVSLLKDTPILLPWSETTLRLPNKVYEVLDWLQDKHGQPLFPDSEEEEYLSPHYTSDDLKLLDPLGLKHVHWTNILARFCSDLSKKTPKMKVNNPIDEDWHMRVAQLFSKGFSSEVDWLCKQIKSLELIPLQANTPVSANVKRITRWVTAENMPIYFPNTGNIPIPSDLGLALVEQSAASNKERKTLFSQLGVMNASSSDIVSLIIKRYTSSSICTMDENIAHLQYLYWNLPQGVSDLTRTIYLFDKEGQDVLCIQSHMEHMYFEEEEEDWQQLFKRGPTENGESPGLDVHFLNSKYIEVVSPTEFQHGRSWKQWLSEIVGVQRYLQLLNPKGNSLSDEFRYVIKYRPDKLVGLLKRFWHVYKHEINRLPAVWDELSSCQVPSASDGDVTETLGSTILPLPWLRDIACELEIVDFPFLKMPEELTEENGNDWQFLTAFGVTSSDDLDFYVNALYRVALENEVGCLPNVSDALFKIYDALGQKCLNASDSTYIREQKMIYIPSNGVQAAEWVISEACVWKGPEWLRTKRSLYGTSKFSTCDQLFRVILKIPNAGWKEYLEDLKVMKLETHVHAVKVKDIYHRLCREFQDDSNSDFVRSLFETSQLVFVPSKNTWVNLSSCIWAENETRIPEKEPLKTDYLELEPFFHKLLGIPKPDIRMHVQGLVNLAENQTEPLELEIKRLINVISALNPTADDVAELQSANIFFIKTQAGQKTRTNSAASFAIIDRSEYGAAFMGKINLLDYTMEEVNACKPLFHSLGMKKKYLSELVDEKTSVDDGEISTKLTETFRNKAYAFVRCKVHYSGANGKEENIALYEKLRNASIYVSNCIVKSMSVVQYGETITVENSRANFHLEENKEGLRLYVSQEENSRQICMNCQLPKRLTTFLHISADPEAQLVITGVINCRTLDAVDGVLEDAGIVEVDGIVQSTDIAQKMYLSGNGDNSSQDGTQTFEAMAQTKTQSLGSYDGHPANTSAEWTGLTTSFAHLSMEVPCRQPTVFGHSTEHSDLLTASTDQSLRSRLSPAESVCPERLMEIANPDIGYVSLLERLIQSAGRITIPAQGIRAVDTLPSLVAASTIPYVSVFAGRSVEADRMIGAAGELLVFGILSNLNLPRFSEENWTSTIRKEVRVHSKYKNLEPWQGRETADFTYNDSEGVFTRLLIEKGYLEINTWEDKRPIYYLEVKTTRNAYDEKFFMSGVQYNRMQDMKLQPERAARIIYVILRVFDLEGRIGLQIYVDPDASRLEGKLQFTVSTWEVEAKTQTRTQSLCSEDTQAFKIFKENSQRLVNSHSNNASATTARALSPRDFSLLEFLLQSQFEEVAQGEFEWLHEVDRLGYSRVEIVELLFEESTDSPWIFFEPSSLTPQEMKLDFHLPNCAHTVEQAGIESTTYSTLASFQFKTKDFATVSTTQDVDSILQQVAESCGLAGIVPSTGNPSTWIGRVVFEHEKTTSRVTYGSSDEKNTHRDLIECCIRALQGLTNAIGYFQQVSCCCDSFTILKLLEHENVKTIQMVQIRFELIDQLHRSLLEILRYPIDISHTSRLHGCTSIVAKVLLIFGIPYCTETGDLIAEDDQLEDRGNTIHNYCLAVQSLCLGFLAYSQAHCGKLQPFFLDTAQQKVLLQGSKLDPGPSWHLHVELLDLTCMGDMLDDSVLVFSAFKEDRKPLTPPTEDTYDLLASPQDLLDTWGPGQFVSLESEPTKGVFCAISIRGGTIKAADSEDGRFHWSRDTVYDAGPQSRFNVKDMLLVGGSVTIKHDCPSDKHHLWENAGEEMSTLGTFEGYWKNTERQAGFQAGEYVSFVFQNVWAREAGRSLKDCHLEQEPLSYSFLQSRWGLQISCCTGVARRVSLCELLADVMPDFVESMLPIPPLWEKLKRDHGIIQAFSGSTLQQWLKDLDEDCRVLALRITRYILSVLRHTGIDHKGEYLTVSWPQKENPFQCLKLNCDRQNFWTRLVADSVDCATFAYITPNCLETTNLKCRGSVPNWYGDSALLDTAVCRHITSTDPAQNIPLAWTLKDKETYCMGKPDFMLMIRVERADPNAVPCLYVSATSIPKSIIRRMFHSKKVRNALNLQKLRERQWIGGRSESVLILVRD